ncbi:hypothetical protein NHX12_001537 [Muraenolepis orangiensis]|uniref:Zyxin n=1 Tax=Muraenolepis orangiensis TaxID=630683 RepID=A0A9Q0E2P0_9TELE|nr:hypothetical protein NHX12_001537 [Muraenolepis orangiensis]
MEDSSSKPVMVTSSINFKVTTPSFYNQPKKFASVAPPRPKSQSPPSAPSPTPVGTAVIGRVGEMPPPPSLCEDFPPPPPPPLDDDDLPAPPPECQALPPAFDAPPPVADDLPLPAPPEESLDSLTDLLSEMETRGPFNPKLPSQYSSAPAPKPSGPPPTAPKPNLSFLPPPEMGDRPPPAPWAEELRARTNRHGNHNAPSGAAAPRGAQTAAKAPVVAPVVAPTAAKAPVVAPTAAKAPVVAPVVAPKAAFGGKTANSATSLPVNKAAPFAPVGGIRSGGPFATGHESARPSPPAAAPPPQPKPSVAPHPSSFNQPMTAAHSSTPSPPGPMAVPGGGVPLNMREVEELERMTNDFIRDMDTHAPVIVSPPTEVCGKCGETLSRTQPAVRAMDKLFHATCFCCMSCQRPLQGMQFYDRDNAPQCEDCYMSSLAVCSRCGERITDRVLKAVGQSFHAHCFRCCTCACSLEGAPFITDDDNNPYCVQDYHRRFSPLCVSCNEPIIPAPGSEETVRVVALDKNFHLKCYRCEDCARPLSIEADADGCYPLDGKILCMKCHTQRAKQAMQ